MFEGTNHGDNAGSAFKVKVNEFQIVVVTEPDSIDINALVLHAVIGQDRDDITVQLVTTLFVVVLMISDIASVFDSSFCVHFVLALKLEWSGNWSLSVAPTLILSNRP